MATIITVHGTFAHMATATSPKPGASPGSTSQRQWWEPDSSFETKLRADIAPADGKLKFEPFIWSGDNSEVARRRAGRQLFRRLRELEDVGEPYCLIGHSHGGSVISHALIFAAVRKVELIGLKRWLTVGTPFIHLRKERFLFLRLSIFWKAIFIASLMLLFMLLFFIVGELLDGQVNFNRPGQFVRLGVGILLTALPFGVFYLFARYMDGRKLFNYRKTTINRAREQYAGKWVALTHEDDEAVNGLKSLRVQSPSIFHRTFAVPAFSMLATFLLPLVYLIMIMSPATMVSIANALRDNVYAMDGFQEKETKFIADEQKIRSLRREIQREQKKVEEADANVVTRLEAETRIKTLRTELRGERRMLTEKYEDLPQLKRVSRFQRRFLQRNGQPCANNTLCDEGRNVILNSKLLFHVVTDEVASLVVDDEFRLSVVGNILRFAIPVLLVPIVFGLIAAAIVFLTQAIATLISSALSRLLDSLTWFEVKRSAMGNDTETEVVLHAERNPDWISTPQPFLPPDLSNSLTAHSNAMSVLSLEKFRNAISEIMVADEEEGAANVLSFLTWQELIHTAYFEVPEFQKLIAQVIAQSEGFMASDTFKAGPAHQQTALWLRALTANAAMSEEPITSATPTA